MKSFYTILTNYGKTALAEALAAQQPLKIPYMAVGDSGGAYYEPTEAQTNLRNELWRGDLNDLRTDEEFQGQVIAEAIIPHGIDGDWTVREIGLFDGKGGLVAVGKYPETYIPPVLSGAKSQVYISIIVKIDNVAAVELIVNHDTVIASKDFVLSQNFWKKIHDADLNAIARANNINIDAIAYLERSTIENVRYFFDPVSDITYYALSPVSGEIVNIGRDIDGVVLISVNGTQSEIYRLGTIAGNTEFRSPESQSTTHAILRSVNIGGTRLHLEPNGNIEGTTAKLDWMFDTYDKDPNNYRIGSIYAYTGDPNSTGEGAVYVYNAKSVGAAWGNWPSMHFGFQDDSVGGTPMKIMFFDTGASQSYAPMKGMWHHGKKVKAGDYVTASNKIYRAVTTGITGNIIPSHTSGSISDASVTWEFIRAPKGQDVKPVVVFGERDDMPILGLPNHRVQALKPIAVGRGGFIDFFGSNDELVGRMIPSTGANGERLLDIISADGGSRLRLNTDNKTLQTANLATTATAKIQNSTPQPNISATALVRIGNSTPYTITKFVGGSGGQSFKLESTTEGNTTIQHNEFIRLKNKQAITMSANSVIEFLMNAAGDVAMEC
ncbi:hypothetical protein A3Q29_00110 [Providencia stuartii]|uniref:Phage tail fibre protein N-terminal domain-containing protein n=1 Tax=Providencia stuartii TaxID=588 RepID=A0A1S1HUY3_PROST|nr:hypothetical protein A3Q29_00110 [Providencia stuartii]